MTNRWPTDAGSQQRVRGLVQQSGARALRAAVVQKSIELIESHRLTFVRSWISIFPLSLTWLVRHTHTHNRRGWSNTNECGDLCALSECAAMLRTVWHTHTRCSTHTRSSACRRTLFETLWWCSTSASQLLLSSARGLSALRMLRNPAESFGIRKCSRHWRVVSVKSHQCEVYIANSRQFRRSKCCRWIVAAALAGNRRHIHTRLAHTKMFERFASVEKSTSVENQNRKTLCMEPLKFDAKIRFLNSVFEFDAKIWFLNSQIWCTNSVFELRA